MCVYKAHRATNSLYHHRNCVSSLVRTKKPAKDHVIQTARRE